MEALIVRWLFSRTIERFLQPNPDIAMLFHPLGVYTNPPCPTLSAHTEPISHGHAGSDIIWYIHAIEFKAAWWVMQTLAWADTKLCQDIFFKDYLVCGCVVDWLFCHFKQRVKLKMHDKIRAGGSSWGAICQSLQPWVASGSVSTAPAKWIEALWCIVDRKIVWFRLLS